MNDINLGQIKDDTNFNFKNTFDEDQAILPENLHTCNYFEMEEMKTKFNNYSGGFSTYSHNIRSLNGHWDDIYDLIHSAQPIKFSVIAFQEVWSVQKSYKIPGYCKLEYKSRDMNDTPNPNCGGGVGLFIDNKYTDYEILEDFSVFIPTPLANLHQAIEIHNNILGKIQNNINYSNCDIEIVSDFTVNLLNFEKHNLTTENVNSLISKSFLPLITLLLHIWTNQISISYQAGIIINTLSDNFPVSYI